MWTRVVCVCRDVSLGDSPVTHLVSTFSTSPPLLNFFSFFPLLVVLFRIHFLSFSFVSSRIYYDTHSRKHHNFFFWGVGADNVSFPFTNARCSGQEKKNPPEIPQRSPPPRFVFFFLRNAILLFKKTTNLKLLTLLWCERETRWKKKMTSIKLKMGGFNDRVSIFFFKYI